MADQRFTMRDAEKHWGIDKGSLSRALNAKGSVGVHLLIRLREIVLAPIDELLALPPLPARQAKPKPKEELTVAQKALKAAPEQPDPGWPNRDHAAKLARLKNVPQNVINAVNARYSDRRFWERKQYWWLSEYIAANQENSENQQVFAGINDAKKAPKRKKKTG